MKFKKNLYHQSKTVIQGNRFKLEAWIKSKFQFDHKKNYLSLHIEKESIGIYFIQHKPLSSFSSYLVAFEEKLNISQENIQSEIIRLLLESVGKEHLKLIPDIVFINSLEDFCFKQFIKQASKNNNLQILS